jgi:putative intracellular protease/amidase
MKRRSVGILIFDDVEVLDFAGPFEVFSRTRLTAGADSRRTDDSAPFETFTVARTRDLVTAIGGLRVMPHYAWSHAPLIDILVVPGGFGTRALLRDRADLRLDPEAAPAVAVTSVCTGALLLAKAGLLNGQRATTHWAGPRSARRRSIRPFTSSATRASCHDGVFTSAGVSAGIDMAFSVVERLCGREVADGDGALHRVSSGVSTCERAEDHMCRNIKTLFNFDPPATDEEIPRGVAAVRAQAERVQRAVEGERGGIRSRPSSKRRGRAAADRLADDERTRRPGEVRRREGEVGSASRRASTAARRNA